jgi:Fe2+ transport system protein FeoA
MIETHNSLTRSHQRKNLPSFTFVGGTSSESKNPTVKRSHLAAFPNAMLLDAVEINTSVTIRKIDTDRDTSIHLHQLGLKPEITVKIVSQTQNGSVIVSLGSDKIGLGSTITQKIVVTLAGEK